MGKTREFKPLVRFKKEIKKNGKERIIDKKIYKTKEEFLLDYSLQDLYSVFKIVDKKEIIVKQTIQRYKTMKGYYWKWN